MRCDLFLALTNAGRSKLAKMLITATTASSSSKVNARPVTRGKALVMGNW